MQNGKNENRVRRAGDDIAERLLESAARIGKVVDAIPDSRLGRHIAGQLIRCGTSPAPNYEEARGAESKKDFVHKLGICLKEMRESCCWIRLTIKSELLPETRVLKLLDEGEQLGCILAKSIVTARGNRKPKDTPEG